MRISSALVALLFAAVCAGPLGVVATFVALSFGIRIVNTAARHARSVRLNQVTASWGFDVPSPASSTGAHTKFTAYRVRDQTHTQYLYPSSA